MKKSALDINEINAEINRTWQKRGYSSLHGVISLKALILVKY